MPKKKVIISACLLGEICRYDGKSKKVNEVVDTFKDYEIIPFCPEAPLFGTPRERINVVAVDSELRIIKEKAGTDVTKLLQKEITLFIELNPVADEIVLKSKSPSCGLESTPVLNNKKEIISYGDGIAAKIFKKKYTNSVIKDETMSKSYNIL